MICGSMGRSHVADDAESLSNRVGEHALYIDNSHHGENQAGADGRNGRNEKMDRIGTVFTFRIPLPIDFFFSAGVRVLAGLGMTFPLREIAFATLFRRHLPASLFSCLFSQQKIRKPRHLIGDNANLE